MSRVKALPAASSFGNILDESRVKAFLDKAVADGKITPERADKIIQMWEIMHAPKPAA